MNSYHPRNTQNWVPQSQNIVAYPQQASYPQNYFSNTPQSVGIIINPPPSPQAPIKIPTSMQNEKEFKQMIDEIKNFAFKPISPDPFRTRFFSISDPFPKSYRFDKPKTIEQTMNSHFQSNSIPQNSYSFPYQFLPTQNNTMSTQMQTPISTPIQSPIPISLQQSPGIQIQGPIQNQNIMNIIPQQISQIHQIPTQNNYVPQQNQPVHQQYQRPMEYHPYRHQNQYTPNNVTNFVPGRIDTQTNPPSQRRGRNQRKWKDNNNRQNYIQRNTQ